MSADDIASLRADIERVNLLLEERARTSNRIEGWLRALVVSCIVQVGALVWFLAADHARQEALAEEVREMKPRVQQLWYESQMERTVRQR